MIRICDDYDLPEMYKILYSHKKIAGVDTPNTNFEDFKNKFSKDIITIGYFVDDQLVSFIITRCLTELPSWVVVMISSMPSNYFSLDNSNLYGLFDAAIEYWESKNIYSFYLIQSVKHRNILNKRVADKMNRMSQYQFPAITLEIIKKGTISQSTLIAKLCKNMVYSDDKVVKWTYNKNLLDNNALQ